MTKKQLKLLQEQKEKLELLMEWKISLLDNADNELEKVMKYIKKQIYPFNPSDSFKVNLKQTIKNFGFNDVISAIDVSISKYLRYDKSGCLTRDSVDMALSKIGGIANLSKKSEIEQKIAYIKGICRNKFQYFDTKRASILLNNYISALSNKDWTKEDIIEDLEKEVIPNTKDCRNWSQWNGLINKWIDDINKW